MKDPRFVLILDIVGSSVVADREGLTRTLQGAIARVNEAFGEDCWAPFEVTKGDEVAAVLHSVARVYDILIEFSEGLAPVRMRAVVVRGELTAGLETRRSTIIDGPAFYEGNARMEELKKSRRGFALASGEESLDRPAEALVNFLLWRWEELTPLQRRVIRLYQEHRHQTRVAEMLGRKQQQVQHTLDVCRWEVIDDAERAVRGLLEAIDGREGEGG